MKELREKDPEIKVTECTKNSAAAWGVMSEAKRAKWHALHDKDVLR